LINMPLVLRAQAEVRLEVPDGITRTIVEALAPEAESPSSERSSTAVERALGGVAIKSSASDTSALRASLNSYLYWVQGIMDVVEKLK
jgi:tRNA threonylcarbamoyladenosine modification (KEOPS) complex  Pcc1 subunit